MKKVAHILNIVYRILFVICFALFAALSILVFIYMDGIIQAFVDKGYAPDFEAAKVMVISSAVSIVLSAIYMIPGFIFTFVDDKLVRQETIRSKYILYGVLTVVFGALPVGVLLIVEGAVHSGAPALE